MKPTLTFELQEMQMSEYLKESSTPDLLGEFMMQHNLEFHLDEDDEIFEGYGTKKTSYPYKQFSCYSRKLCKQEIQTAVLENDYIKATFLPTLGGRLWSLIDKKENKNLLYTNDVIRYSNLATRNAWFSGGAEWNIGIIGHSPFTTEPLFTAQLKDDLGNPILRMYEYEKIRGVEYQMDFWLGEKDTFLNCRMRIVNTSNEVVPMYWWSNIAVPERKNGRVIVPAEQAYTYRHGGVYKVDIPMVDGVDISKYENIELSVDYFFYIPKDMPKYIVNVDENGYGLFHLSTSRLQSRKLFSWGNIDASNRWQEFLTEDAGRYVEIQAGLGKTQYGCLPMPPHSAWEWIEQYGSIKLEKEKELPYEQLRDVVSEIAQKVVHERDIETVLKESKKTAKTKASVQSMGRSFSALHRMIREKQGEGLISSHLDFGTCEKELKRWMVFLETGLLSEPSVEEAPDYFISDSYMYELLKKSIEEKNKDNWYAYYQLGLYCFMQQHYKSALDYFYEALRLKESAWVYHAIAAALLTLEEKKKACEAMLKGLRIRKQDMTYVKEGLKIVMLCGAAKEVLEFYKELSDDIANESRIYFIYLRALYETGEVEKAYELLNKDSGFVLEDVREGMDSIGALWSAMHKDLFGGEEKIPHKFNFMSS